MILFTWDSEYLTRGLGQMRRIFLEFPAHVNILLTYYLHPTTAEEFLE